MSAALLTRRAALFGAAAALGLSAAAQESDAARLDRLHAQLLRAGSEAEARRIEGAIWRIWVRGPSADATDRLRAAMGRREAYDFAGALEILDGVVADHPGWAEGWNQRGYIRFLREEYDEALADVNRALEIEPRHFAAKAGAALILMRQGRMQPGQKALREALELNPWLRERALLIPLPEPEEI